MDEFNDALNARHLELERQLEAVIAAGRAGRWTEYRLHFGVLREGLLRHMAFAEEALHDEHARLRRHLEMLGAAAPERDPEGCLAELEHLAEQMRALHAAETALDSRFAAGEMPRLALEELPAIDLRGLQPPEPIVRIFQALERNPGAPLRVILPHEPVPLYALLRERGFSWSGAVRADGGYELAISRA
jgi:uncharacterized protein (DUF2249 family)